MVNKTIREWEDEMLALPLAGRVSGEHEEHGPESPEFNALHRPDGGMMCRCDRCRIIRIKRRRAFRFPMTKCPGCGELFFSIYTRCEKCRGSNTQEENSHDR